MRASATSAGIALVCPSCVRPVWIEHNPQWAHWALALHLRSCARL